MLAAMGKKTGIIDGNREDRTGNSAMFGKGLLSSWILLPLLKFKLLATLCHVFVGWSGRAVFAGAAKFGESKECDETPCLNRYVQEVLF